MNTNSELSRRRLREKVLQALYALEISNDEPQYIIDTLLSDKELITKQNNFAQLLFKSVLQNSDYCKKEIKSISKNWDEKRIAIIDKILLYMGMCEMLNFEDIPVKVTFNEIIELAKSYSTEKSPKFINGILNTFLQKELKSGNIIKSGKGLK